MIVSGVKLASPEAELTLELETAGIFTVIFLAGVMTLGVVFMITLVMALGAGLGTSLKTVGVVGFLVGMK